MELNCPPLEATAQWLQYFPWGPVIVFIQDPDLDAFGFWALKTLYLWHSWTEFGQFALKWGAIEFHNFASDSRGTPVWLATTRGRFMQKTLKNYPKKKFKKLPKIPEISHSIRGYETYRAMRALSSGVSGSLRALLVFSQKNLESHGAKPWGAKAKVRRTVEKFAKNFPKVPQICGLWGS